MVDLIIRLNDGHYVTWIEDKCTVYNKLGQVVDKGYREHIMLNPGVGRRCLLYPCHFGYVIIYIWKYYLMMVLVLR